MEINTWNHIKNISRTIQGSGHMTLSSVILAGVSCCDFLCLSRDRFLLLLKFLHLADNSKQVAQGQPGYDKLFKLRPFMDPLIHSFKEMFIPQQQLSIDEAMISYKGQLSFLQYLPKKPKRWGMKAWALC